VTRLSEHFGRVFCAIPQYLDELKEIAAGPPFAMYHNMDMNDLDVEAGFPVARALPTRGEIQANTLPAGEIATCVHVGPYDQVERTYKALLSFIGEQGRVPASPPYEFYLNGPADTPAEKLLTKVVMPVRKAEG
jgi:effector-binding domain-containing protein